MLAASVALSDAHGGFPAAAHKPGLCNSGSRRWERRPWCSRGKQTRGRFPWVNNHSYSKSSVLSSCESKHVNQVTRASLSLCHHCRVYTDWEWPKLATTLRAQNLVKYFLSKWVAIILNWWLTLYVRHFSNVVLSIKLGFNIFHEEVAISLAGFLHCLLLSFENSHFSILETFMLYLDICVGFSLFLLYSVISWVAYVFKLPNLRNYFLKLLLSFIHGGYMYGNLRTNYGSQFSPSTVGLCSQGWGLVVSAFPYWTIYHWPRKLL